MLDRIGVPSGPALAGNIAYPLFWFNKSFQNTTQSLLHSFQGAEKLSLFHRSVESIEEERMQGQPETHTLR